MRSSSVSTTVLVGVILLIVVSACHRDDKCCGPGMGTGVLPVVTGSWRLVRVEGGILGGIFTLPADSPVVLTLHADSSYEVQNKMVRGDTGTFHLADSAVYGTYPMPVIVFSAGVTPLGGGAINYIVTPDSLFLSADVADGYQAAYVKTN